MLPLEMWQEALDFCSFPDYTRMICFSWGFYYLFKQSLLELRIDTLFPSPALGGLWMASRDMQATFTRVLHLGLLVFECSCAFGARHFFFACRKNVDGFSCGGGATGGDRAAAFPAETGVFPVSLQRAHGEDAPVSCSLCPCATPAGGGTLFPFRRSEWRCRAAG